MNYYIDRIKPEYYESIKEYRDEVLKIGSKIDGLSQLEKYDDIEKWDLNNKLYEQEETLPPGYAIGFVYAYICNDEVVGLINFRPTANNNPYLSKYGGHIGYNVKPSKRRQGIGNRMLKDFLVICKNDYQLDRVMISCLENNEASRKIILNNGGKFENKVFYPPKGQMIERYWIEL